MLEDGRSGSRQLPQEECGTTAKYSVAIIGIAGTWSCRSAQLSPTEGRALRCSTSTPRPSIRLPQVMRPSSSQAREEPIKEARQEGRPLASTDPAVVSEGESVVIETATEVNEYLNRSPQGILTGWTDGRGPATDASFRCVSDPPVPNDVQKCVADAEKAKRPLGFEARTTRDEMLDEVIPWFEQALSEDAPWARPAGLTQVSTGQPRVNLKSLLHKPPDVFGTRP